jgi:hypothetical protein
MDPFLENQEWEDFHTRFNTVVSEFLSPRIEPRYIVRVERRVYVESADEQLDYPRRADVAVMLAAGADGDTRAAALSAGTTAVAPVECELPMPQEQRETYLVIRERETTQVVTVLETLSPGNKRVGGEGRHEYLKKRVEILQSDSHLVELDLLRGGQRLPTKDPLPPGDYYAIVSRARRRPRAEVYAWTIRQALPAIPVPLKKGDADVPLDLQAVFSTVYDRARYDLSVNYQWVLEPPLSESDAAWAADLLKRNPGGGT